MIFEDVVERMIEEKKNPLILDAWVDRDCEAFKCVRNTFTQNGGTWFEYLNIGDFKFKAEYTKGGGAGMGEFPAEIRLYCLVNFEKRRIES